MIPHSRGSTAVLRRRRSRTRLPRNCDRLASKRSNARSGKYAITRAVAVSVDEWQREDTQMSQIRYQGGLSEVLKRARNCCTTLCRSPGGVSSSSIRRSHQPCQGDYVHSEHTAGSRNRNRSVSFAIRKQGEDLRQSDANHQVKSITTHLEYLSDKTTPTDLKAMISPAQTSSLTSAQLLHGASVAELLDCLPPTMRTGFNPRPGHSRILASGNRGGRCRWSAGFPGDLPFSQPLHSDNTELQSGHTTRTRTYAITNSASTQHPNTLVTIAEQNPLQIVVNQKGKKPPTYSDEKGENVQEFLENFQSVAEINAWNDTGKCRRLKSQLKNTAKHVLENIGNQSRRLRLAIDRANTKNHFYHNRTDGKIQTLSLRQTTETRGKYTPTCRNHEILSSQIQPTGQNDVQSGVEIFGPTLNIEDLIADESKVRWAWSSTGMKEQEEKGGTTNFLLCSDADVILNRRNSRSRGVVLVRLLASQLGEPGSIPGGVTPGISHVTIVPDDGAGRRVFSGVSSFLRPCIPALIHTSLRPHTLSRPR
ncbi:hypothetical protein PR048_033389, partial [Dryococelus australis]